MASRKFDVIEGGRNAARSPHISNRRRLRDWLWPLPLIGIMIPVTQGLGGYVLLAALLIWVAFEIADWITARWRSR